MRRGSSVRRSACSWRCSPWDCGSCFDRRRPRWSGPTSEQLAAAATIVAGQEQTFANLVFLRDKALALERRPDAFLMYGVQGRTWVALGDPVGPRAPPSRS